MDNIENYLYLAFAVIYMISRLFKAKGKSQSPPQRHQNPSDHTSQPPKRKKAFSFEDIIKEFEKSLVQEEEEVAPVPKKEIRHRKPVPVPVVEPARKPSKYEKFEGTSYSQKSFSKPSKEGLQVIRDDAYTIEKDHVTNYVDELQSPEDYKRAFVLSEIITRKYF